MQYQIKKCMLIYALLCILISIFPRAAEAKTVAFPLSIDYPLLGSLVIRTAFTDPGQTARLADEQNQCWDITLSEPIFTENGGLLNFRTKVRVHAGVYVLNRCILPIDWKGYLVLVQKPEINKNWMLSFQTLDSSLYDTRLQPATIAGIVWKLVQTSVYDYLSNITINLAPPVSELKLFLQPLFPPDMQTRATRMADSMKPGKVASTRDAVQIEILAEVEQPDKKDKNDNKEILSGAELTRFIKNWETWDAFLVFIMTSLTEEPLSKEDRQILLDVLLETRHRFITGLVDKTLGRDFVRDQFLSAWRQLSTIFRHHLGDDPSKDLFGYLSFFTAFDALFVLDQIGPALGIEISRNGLIRLIRMISDENEDVLVYQISIDKKLRTVLGLGSPPQTRGPAFDGEEIDVGNKKSDLLRFLFQPVWAKEKSGRIDYEKIKKWIIGDTHIDPYLERVKALLENAVNTTLKNSPVAKPFHNLFQRVVLSTAWQESCFRQFIKEKGKVTYLRSYNGTSVGLMQINERVWRGIYDLSHLRWDIRYNSMAGCEIIALYFNKYALRKLGNQNLPDDPTFAGLIYAMYNGGPGQLRKYPRRKQQEKYYLSDRLFSEKYAWVTRQQWEKIRICLGGR